MADLNLPPHSFFDAAEGKPTILPHSRVYTLVSSLNIPTANSSNSSTAHFTPSTSAVSQPLASTQAGQPATDAPAPPPQYPSKLAVVAVRFPVKDGSAGLGLSMGRGKGKDVDSGGLLAPGAAEAGGAAGEGSGPNPSPLMKRRALPRSFSMLGSSTPAGDGAISTTRPARTFKGSSSSFIRSWEGLPLSQPQLRTIAEGNAGKETIFGFQTLGKSVVWHEIAKGKKDALSRVVFSAFPTCIDANQHTASHTQMDILIGFATGDILWFDPLTARYSRFNKSGVISSSPVTSILWLPPAPSSSTQPPASPTSENRSNLFLTSHADGTILIWDKDREDAPGIVPNPAPTAGLSGAEKGRDWTMGGATMGNGKVPEGCEDMVVTRQGAVDKKGVRLNPVSHWKLSKKAITAFAFSPDLQLCAAVGEDGCLRIIDAVEERLLDVFSSYFGALNCVAFSPDGRFVVTGGQDDLCTVYAPLEQHVVAHCQGHSSWITSLAWDPWRSDERSMRFVSTGEDCKVVLWDLSSAALTRRPKAHAHPAARRHSHSSQYSIPRRSNSESHAHLPLDPSERIGPSFHRAPRRDDVSLLQPVMVKTLSNDFFAGVKVLPDYLIFSSRKGEVKQYDRPPLGEGLLGGLMNEFAASVVRIDARAR
ncbi:hypothetical protein JCM11641_003787 [Rhodosporidiobolus odoratus]